MMISEKKMQIVIDNYFKSECDVDTSIRQAFEKGFRIGVKKGMTTDPTRHGKWISVSHKKARICSVCECDEPYKFADEDADVFDYCPHCGAKMGAKEVWRY